MICQFWLIFLIIIAKDVDSSPQWIRGQIYYSPVAYRIQNNPWASKDIGDVPIELDVAKPARGIENEKRPNINPNQYILPEPPYNEQQPPYQQGKQEDGMAGEMFWQEQFSCL